MHFYWRMEQEVEKIIKETADDKKWGLIVLVAMVEAYFEFIAAVLLESFPRGVRTKKVRNMFQAIERMFKKSIITEKDKKRFHAIRDLRNKVLHNIVKELDWEDLQDFIEENDDQLNTLKRELIARNQNEQEALIGCFRDKVIEVYALISNKYKQTVDEKLAYFLEQ